MELEKQALGRESVKKRLFAGVDSFNVKVSFSCFVVALGLIVMILGALETHLKFNEPHGKVTWRVAQIQSTHPI